MKKPDPKTIKQSFDKWEKLSLDDRCPPEFRLLQQQAFYAGYACSLANITELVKMYPTREGDAVRRIRALQHEALDYFKLALQSAPDPSQS